MKIYWKKITKQNFLITMLIATLVSFPAFAYTDKNFKDYKHCHCPKEMKQKMDNMMKEIGITPEQKQKLDAIKEESRSKSEPVLKCLMEKKRAQMQYLMTPQANKDQALAQEKEISRLQEQLAEIRINSIFEMKNVLTPEQQQKFAEIQQKRMKECPEEHTRLQKPGGMEPMY